jgi:hypothetical protein
MSAPSASFEALSVFFETSPAAVEAVRRLSDGAEVGVLLDGNEQARFYVESGRPHLARESARDPDFTLTIPDGAVRRLVSLESPDVGEYGIAFFMLVTSSDPDLRVRVQIGASTMRLIGKGYLRVLAAGGTKVTLWLLKKGALNPKAAIDRLRQAL